MTWSFDHLNDLWNHLALFIIIYHLVISIVWFWLANIYHINNHVTIIVKNNKCSVGKNYNAGQNYIQMTKVICHLSIEICHLSFDSFGHFKSFAEHWVNLLSFICVWLYALVWSDTLFTSDWIDFNIYVDL